MVALLVMACGMHFDLEPTHFTILQRLAKGKTELWTSRVRSGLLIVSNVQLRNVSSHGSRVSIGVLLNASLLLLASYQPQTLNATTYIKPFR